MATTKCPVIKGVITALGTTPQERGLETPDFKAKFDEEPNGIIDYINNTLTVEVDAHMAESATIIENVAALKSNTNLKINDYVYVRGYYVAEDGGSGTFVITDTEPVDKFYHELDNDLYAVNVDNNFLLPRYGGYYVNIMMDNVRPFLREQQSKIVILPAPNSNHPGCFSYEHEEGTVYIWEATDTVVFNESCAETEFYFNGEISCRNDEADAIFKISDAIKPENLYFHGHTQLTGWHFGATTVYVKNNLLIEGGARINFDELQCAYAINNITLGGVNDLNPIEFNANFIETGSSTGKVLNVVGSYSTIFCINNMAVQNLLSVDTDQIYIRAPIYSCYIGQYRCSPTIAGYVGEIIDSEVPTAINAMGENLLRINSMRSGGNRIIVANGGCYSFGLVQLACSAESARMIIAEDESKLCFEQLFFRNADYTITSGVYSLISIGQTYPSPIITAGSRNIVVNGINIGDGHTTTTISNGLYYDSMNDKMIPVIKGVMKTGATFN